MDAIDAKEERHESEEILKVLQALKKNPEMTQRDLARMVGISLGKINFILKSLIHKGLVKTHNFKNSNNKKAYIYILTPSGIEEKARITYRFLKRKIQEYEQLEEQIRLLRKEVSETEPVPKTETGSSQKSL
jgi:EPS-associated MarR family transcriptional regulator